MSSKITVRVSKKLWIDFFERVSDEELACSNVVVTDTEKTVQLSFETNKRERVMEVLKEVNKVVKSG